MQHNISKVTSIGSCEHLRGMRVLVRAGIDAPVSPSGTVVDDFRIKKSLPTLQFLRAAGARVIIIGHTSRADGSSDASLKEICTVLNTFIPVSWAGGVLGDDVERSVASLKDGELVMLENLRFVSGEKENDLEFAKALAALGDVYVNDSFSVSHRKHASIVSLPKLLPSYAGLQFMDELENLSIARAPKAPSFFVIGGAKFETKLPLVESLLDIYDSVFIGGALANNFFKAQGYEMGTSLVSDIDITQSKLFKNPKLMLPVDVTVQSVRGSEVKKPSELLSDEMILDAGPQTLALLQKKMDETTTLLWNGPLGDYERGFATYTNAFAEIVSRSKAISIVGGGDTVASITDPQVTERFTFLSTAGGAMLSFLEQGSLPGIDALNKTSSN